MKRLPRFANGIRNVMSVSSQLSEIESLGDLHKISANLSELLVSTLATIERAKRSFRVSQQVTPSEFEWSGWSRECSLESAPRKKYDK